MSATAATGKAVLYVDADADRRRQVADALDRAAPTVRPVGTVSAALSALDGADCLVVGVVDEGTVPELLWTVAGRRPSLPTVVYADLDRERLRAAFRAGATDVVDPGNLAELLDRVAAARRPATTPDPDAPAPATGADAGGDAADAPDPSAGRDAGVDAATDAAPGRDEDAGAAPDAAPGPGGDGDVVRAVGPASPGALDPFRALRELYEVGTDPELGVEETVRRLLSAGRRRLGVSEAFLAAVDVDRDRHEVVEAVGDGDLFPVGTVSELSSTFCRDALDDGEFLAIPDVGAADRASPADRERGVACYLGGRVVVEGESYGTVCYVDDEPRRPFTRAERAFVRQVTAWVRYELERDRRETRLREARRRVERVLERTTEAVLAVDGDWRITYLNDGAETVLRAAADGGDGTGDRADGTGPDPEDGVDPRDREAGSEADLVGRDLWSVVPGAVDTVFDDRLREAMATQEPVTFTDRYPPLGAHFEVRAYPSETGLSVYLADVTDRVERERDLEMYEAIVDTAADMIYALDAEGRFVAANDALLEATGYDRAEVLGSHASLLTDEATTAHTDRVQAGLGEGEVGVVETEVRTRDGDTIPVENRFAPFPPDAEDPRGRVGVARDVSDRVERERELRRYAALVENAEDMMYVLDQEGRFTLVTDRLAERFGYDRERLVGAEPSLLLDEEDRSRARSAVAEARYGDADTAVFEVTCRTADGQRVPVEVRATPLSGDPSAGTVGVVRDRTELAETRQRLSVEQERFTYLFDSLPDPAVEVGFVGGDAVPLKVNDAFEDTFGVDARTALGESLTAHLRPSAGASPGPVADPGATDGPDGDPGATDGDAPAAPEPPGPGSGDEDGARESGADDGDRSDAGDGAAGLDDVVARLADGESTTAELRLRAVSGPRDFLVRGVPFTEHEGDVRAFVIFTDITEQRRRERRLKVLYRVLRHNLRNRMTVVDGYADVIAEAVDDPGVVDTAEQLRSAAEDVTSLSEKARTVRRAAAADAGEGPVDVAAVARTVAAAYRDRATVAVDAPGSAWVAGDDRLVTAVDNLVENAVEHGGDRVEVTVAAGDADAGPGAGGGAGAGAEPGGDTDTDDGPDGDTDAGAGAGTGTTAGARSRSTRPDRVVVTVADDGPGIPESERAVVAGDRDITKVEHGSGLGLWLVRWVVESLGGEVTFGTDPDRTVVRLSLQAAPAPADPEGTPGEVSFPESE